MLVFPIDSEHGPEAYVGNLPLVLSHEGLHLP